MKLLYQGVQFGDINCVRFVWGREALIGADRLVYGYSNFADFGEIAFAVSGQADCATKMAVIETAFSLPYGDLLVKNDDASNSVNSVLSSGTVEGVRPTRLVWDDRAGAQFTTWRSFNAAFEWETRIAGLASSHLIDFTESVTVQGGTAKTVVQEPINVATSAYDAFITVPKQKYVVTQSGRAVGLTQYPIVGTIAPYVLSGVPTVVFTGGGGSGAAGYAVVNGFGVVTGVVVTAPGTLYSSPPTVTFVGGLGSGATATASVSAGQVIGVSVVDGGTGYLVPEPTGNMVRYTTPQKAGATQQQFTAEWSFTWELGSLGTLPIPNVW